MFAHDDSQSPHIDKYFAESPNNSISWINDLGKGRYSTASATLLKEAEHASNLDAKHVSARVLVRSVVTYHFHLVDAQYWKTCPPGSTA